MGLIASDVNVAMIAECGKTKVAIPSPSPHFMHVLPRKPTNNERVAAILERDAPVTISDWPTRVERESELTSVQLTNEQRTGHQRSMQLSQIRHTAPKRELF